MTRFALEVIEMELQFSRFKTVTKTQATGEQVVAQQYGKLQEHHSPNRCAASSHLFFLWTR